MTLFLKTILIIWWRKKNLTFDLTFLFTAKKSTKEGTKVMFVVQSMFIVFKRSVSETQSQRKKQLYQKCWPGGAAQAYWQTLSLSDWWHVGKRLLGKVSTPAILYSQEKRIEGKYKIIFLWKVAQALIQGYQVTCISNSRRGRLLCRSVPFAPQLES